MLCFDDAVEAFAKKIENDRPDVIWQQPSRDSSFESGGAWYFYNVNGFLGRLTEFEAERLLGRGWPK